MSLTRCLTATAVLLVAAGVILLPGSHKPPAQAAGDCTVSSGDLSLDAEEQAFLTLINNYRAQNGAGPLSISPSLTKAAAWKSRDMADNDYFSHYDRDGRTADERMVDCGYPYTTTAAIGENIAGGYSGASAVFNAWKNSAGHNAAMLNPNYAAIGIGRTYKGTSIWGWYWTTDFGGILDGAGTTPAETPNPSPSPAASPSASATPAPTPAPVGDIVPPSVNLTSPAEGQTVSGRVAVKASASDNVGVSKLAFFVDGALIKTDTSAPFSISWNARGASAGPHVITARAYDGAGNRADDANTVSVSR